MFGLFGDSEKEKAKKRQKLIAKAQKRAAAARDEIGDETLQKINEAMQKRAQSESEKAKKQLQNSDKEKLAAHLRSIIDDK